MKKKHIRLLNESAEIMTSIMGEYDELVAKIGIVTENLSRVGRYMAKNDMGSPTGVWSASCMLDELNATMTAYHPADIRESILDALGGKFKKVRTLIPSIDEEIESIPNHINAADAEVGSQVFMEVMRKNLEDFNAEIFGIRATLNAMCNEIKSVSALTAKIPEMTDEERKNIVRIITTEELNGIFNRHVTDDLIGAPKTGKTGPAASILGEGADSGATTPSEDARQPHFPARQQAESGLAAIPTHENPSEGPSCADSEVVPVSSVIPVRDDFDDVDDFDVDHLKNCDCDECRHADDVDDPVMPENENKWVPPRRRRRANNEYQDDE